MTMTTISTNNIAYATIPALVAERNKLLRHSNLSVAKVVQSLIENRLEEYREKLESLEKAKSNCIEKEQFEVLVYIRRDAEFWQFHISEAEKMVKVYHVCDPVMVQLSI